MTKTLKNLVESYQKGKFNTPNIQIIDRIFSDEMIILPDGKLLNMTFNRALFKKSRLTKIKFYNGSFESSFFTASFLNWTTQFEKLPDVFEHFAANAGVENVNAAKTATVMVDFFIIERSPRGLNLIESFQNRYNLT